MNKLRAIISLAALTAYTFCATAQNVADSVRIKIKTTAGAELYLDGEMSSTNLMTAKVPVGKHTVTIKVGYSFEQSYDIDVNHANTEFSFPVEGKITVDCTPQAQLSLDGIPQGMTPKTLNVLGTHNIKLQGNEVEYYDISEQIIVKPLENISRSYTLKKRPPRLYGMVIGNFSSCMAGGLTLAMCRNWGFYVRCALNGFDFPNDDTSDYFRNTNIPENGDGVSLGPYKKDGDPEYFIATGGIMKRASKNLYVYAGAGYGTFGQGYNNVYYHYWDGYYSGANGVAGDIGVIFKYRALLLQVGYASILTGKWGDCDWHHDPYVGIGISLHKQKKSK